ncbi:hypothetical protein LTR97_004586 [Elasticomyces elasticus]|uniref:Uncharacterized protein n=1 Tax=Elasticomyces elasticus TaxID=574655 RepID=A0AAN8A2G1_9PEZI|nr:hypothetical protein LTR97_004586 [Elasticomyces elasticus]
MNHSHSNLKLPAFGIYATPPELPPPPPPKHEELPVQEARLRTLCYRSEQWRVEYDHTTKRWSEVLDELVQLYQRQTALVLEMEGCVAGMDAKAGT